MADDLASRLGGSICDAATELIHRITDTGTLLREENFKFVAEAIIATALHPLPAAAALNRELAIQLFAKAHAILLGNPQRVTMFALPMTYVLSPPREAEFVRNLFLRLHERGTAEALSYPAYRNVEIEYAYCRMQGREFHRELRQEFLLAFPWMTRDQAYALTHIHFYNSDFGRRTVAYEGAVEELLEALIARAMAAGDLDLLLELAVCYASTDGIDAPRLRHCDWLVARSMRGWWDTDGRLHRQLAFREAYHQLFVAWMYLAVRASAYSPRHSATLGKRLSALSLVMQPLDASDPVGFLAAYGDFSNRFGESRLFEPIVETYGYLIDQAVRRRGSTGCDLVLRQPSS